MDCSRRWRHERRCRIPFLTDIDSRAAIKGSRDPLGVQPIWTKLGRHIVGNLTTVSTSVRDFTTLLLGYYFAERVAESGGSDGDLAVFLKWEQLAAYARWEIVGDHSFRGTERTGKNLQETRRASRMMGVGSSSRFTSLFWPRRDSGTGTPSQNASPRPASFLTLTGSATVNF